MKQLASIGEQPTDERFETLKKWIYLMSQVFWARSYFDMLKASEPVTESSTLQGLLRHQGLLSCFVLSYWKCFGQSGRGRPSLDAKQVFQDDAHLHEIHERIGTIRHKHFAHNDESGLDAVAVSVIELNAHFEVSYKMAFALPLNEYSYYEKVLDTLEKYVVDQSERHKSAIEKSVGKPIQIKEG